jgi:hypothetical protein
MHNSRSHICILWHGFYGLYFMGFLRGFRLFLENQNIIFGFLQPPIDSGRSESTRVEPVLQPVGQCFGPASGPLESLLTRLTRIGGANTSSCGQGRYQDIRLKIHNQRAISIKKNRFYSTRNQNCKKVAIVKGSAPCGTAPRCTTKLLVIKSDPQTGTCPLLH